MTVRAVVFDIGKVLIGWDPEGFYDRVIGRERRDRLFAEVPLHPMNIGLDNGDPWLQSVTALADLHPGWRDEIMLWHDRWGEMTGPVFDHSLRLMRRLKRKGTGVYALTNFGGETFRHAAQTLYPFFAEFDGAAVSGDLRTMKPDQPIYAEVERLSGLSDAALLFTDDKQENIEAAARRGWKTHLFTEPAPFAARLVAEGLLTAEEAT
jgi:2-haloacid dehalogenase